MASVKREFSAGGVVFKKEKGRVLWLIIQPRADGQPWRKGRWQLPKGWIDEGETSQEAATREVKEEGGVEAEIIDKVSRFDIFFHNEEKQKVVKNVVFYLMRYRGGSEKDHSEETSEAVWLPYKKAYERLTFKSEKLLEESKRQPKLL